MEERDQLAAVLYAALVEAVVTKKANGVELRYLSETTTAEIRAELTTAARLSLVAADVFQFELKREASGP